MKKFMVGIVALALTLSFSKSAFSQEERLKTEDWQKQMTEQTQMRSDTKAKLDKLNADIAALKQQSAQKDDDFKKCNDEMSALIGASKADVDAFEPKVAAAENKANELARLSNQDLLARKVEIDSLQKQVNDLKASKISVLPAYYDRIAALQQKIDALRAALANMEKFYTVGTWSKDRDCLWNISKKKDIYANPFLWPKIWQANRDKIKDPDVIHHGQKLKIPINEQQLTDAEKKAANHYYKRKASTEK
jgi:nucleoid-associated protein YgaU